MNRNHFHTYLFLLLVVTLHPLVYQQIQVSHSRMGCVLPIQYSSPIHLIPDIIPTLQFFYPILQLDSCVYILEHYFCSCHTNTLWWVLLSYSPTALTGSPLPGGMSYGDTLRSSGIFQYRSGYFSLLFYHNLHFLRELCFLQHKLWKNTWKPPFLPVHVLFSIVHVNEIFLDFSHYPR